MFSRHATKQNGQLTLIQRDVDELKGMVREMQTSLSGSGGAPGLLTNFATLCQRVSSIETILGNDIAHLNAKMDTMFTSQQIMTEQRNQSQAELKAKEDSNTVKWSDVLKDWVKPVITGLILSTLLYFLLR